MIWRIMVIEKDVISLILQITTKCESKIVYYSKITPGLKTSKSIRWTSIDVKFPSSIPCLSASSGDKGMLISSADILQIADVVHQVEDELLDKTHFRN